MAGSFDDRVGLGSQTLESDYFDQMYVEPIYDAFVCPLTKKIMRDPVAIENGRTFEREAIEKWFKECRESGEKLRCPMTLNPLKSANLSPSLALQNTIEEWIARNEATQLDKARRSLNLHSPENEINQCLTYVQHVCQKGESNKHVARDAGLIPMIIDLLKSGSQKVRCTVLETLRILVEGDNDNKEILVEGSTVRSIVKLLSHELSKEREEAIYLLYELSKSEVLAKKIGSIHGAILILVDISSSKRENLAVVKTANKTLENLEMCEVNVRQMAEYGRWQPLLKRIIEGPSETKLSMTDFLGELVLSNDVKLLVAKTVGSSLINFMKSSNIQTIEASLKALNQISSFEASATVLIEEGILPPLVKDLFAFGPNQLPARLKEVSATILANVVNSGFDFASVPVGHDNRTTLVSEDIVHNLFQLISNNGPTIACKLLQVLVGLTSTQVTVLKVVAAVRNSGAAISLVQFIDAPQQDLRLATIKLLQNLSSHMGHELADALCGSVGQLGSLFSILSEDTGITEEQAAVVGFLAALPERDSNLTQLMLNEGAFEIVYFRIVGMRHRETKGSRFVAPFQAGLLKILARVTFILADEASAIAFCCNHKLASLFIEQLQSNGLDNVQMISAKALENLSLESKNLTTLPELPATSFCGLMFPCCSGQPDTRGLCRLHHGTCSLNGSFCVLEGRAVEKLVALLDHTNERVVEAALAALSTMLEDGVDIKQGVAVLREADGIKAIFEVLLEQQSEDLRKKAVWTVERLLRTKEIACEMSENPNISSALVDAFQNADDQTRRVAERALRHVDRLPNFSGFFPNMP